MGEVVREFNVDNRCSPGVSTYDRFSAGLVASILIFGFVVLSLLMIWLFGVQQQSSVVLPDLDYQVMVVDDPAGLEEELNETIGGSNSTELVSLLQSVENAVSNQAAGDGSPESGNFLPGLPDGREPGPAPVGSHSSRWKVGFDVEDIEQYKRQMDFFGIEIGVIESRQDDVWRIGKLSSDAQVTHSSRDKERHSTWFAHSKPLLKRWDQKIARESGVAIEGGIYVQFYPENLVARIMLLEAEALRQLGRDLDQVDTTNIRITQSGNQFLVSVSDFEFR